MLGQLYRYKQEFTIQDTFCTYWPSTVLSTVNLASIPNVFLNVTAYWLLNAQSTGQCFHNRDHFPNITNIRYLQSMILSDYIFYCLCVLSNSKF